MATIDVRPEGTTPAEADQWEADALAAIGAVQDPAEAEELLRMVRTVEQAMRLSKVSGDRERRWRGMRLKAEARYGELLGPAEPGGNSARVTDGYTEPTGRMQASRARKVAAAKRADPEGFEDYIENDEAPSRAGLLRKTRAKTEAKAKAKKPKRKSHANRRRASGEPTFQPGTTLAYDDAVIRWVRARARRGWTREKIIATSRSGEDGWPRPGESLGDGGSYAEVRQAIYRSENPERPDGLPKRSGRRLRELKAQEKAGTLDRLTTVRYDLARIQGLLESVDVLGQRLDESSVWTLQEFHNDLMELQTWLLQTLDGVEAQLDDSDKWELIQKLERPEGRTALEYESFKARAALLRRKYKMRIEP